MASIKIVRRKNKERKDGSAPLALRVSDNYRTSYRFLGQYILEKDWDKTASTVKRSHPNYKKLNNFLMKKLIEANDIYFDLKKESLTPKLYFKNKPSLRFQDINERFIERFKNFCTIYLGHKERTITNQLIFVRTLFNVAIRDDIVPSKYYPFAGEKEKIRIGSGHKIGLTIKEVERIEQLELEPGTSIWHTRNVWLMAFYFAGIRISDVVQIKWSDFKDNRLFYVMNKNSKPVSLKIPDKAQAILNLYG